MSTPTTPTPPNPAAIYGTPSSYSIPIPSIPDNASVGDETISWLTNAVAEAEAFLTAQAGWDLIPQAIATIMGQDETEPLDSKSPLSNTRTNRVAKIAEDLAGLMTDTKPFWDYSVFNKRFEQHAQIYGKLATQWYQKNNIDLRWADVIKYALACGSGYLHVFYDPSLKDLNACAEDPRNVLPIRPIGYESLESCLGVIVKRKVPINYIKDRYGVQIKADSDGSAISMWARAKEAASDLVSPIHKWTKAAKAEPDIPKIPTVTLFRAYIKDDRRNTKQDMRDKFKNGPVEMGPFHDEDRIEEISGPPDPMTGQPTTVSSTRKVRVPDFNWCYVVKVGEPLYPNLRQILWAGGIKLYDGPAFNWHGRFPLLKLTLCPWPWSWLGKAPIWDLLKLHKSLNCLLRVIDDHAAQVAQPGSVHDKNSVSRSTYDSFDTRRAGWKIYQNPLVGKGIQIVNPPLLDQSIWEHVKWIIEEMETLSGKLDLTKMLNLNQLPSNSTIESILNSMTPSLRFRSRIMEAFARDLAMMLAYDFTQYYTLPMRVTILGPGGTTQDDFDYDPGSLVPDFVSDNDYDSSGNITPEAMNRGPSPRYDRAREFLRRFVFKVAPGSLLNAAQVEQKLIYLQLARAGWMDIYTLWEVLGIPNIGVLPDNVRTIPERIQYQLSQGLGGNVNPAGRKASGQELPRIIQKES